MSLNRAFVIFIFVFLLCLSNSINALSPKVKITHIANEGYLITTLHHKILVDALFDEDYGVFETPTKETINAIMEGTAPFDSVNLFFLTHYHKDHCNPALVFKYLKRNKNICLVTNKPTLVFIDGDQFGFVGCKKQFVELTPELNRCLSKSVDDLNIISHSIKHLPLIKNDIDLEEYMYNTAYTIETDGVTIFHSGDTDFNNLKAYFDTYKYKNKSNIDVAFLYYGLLNLNENLHYIKEKLNPQKIVLMHVPVKKIDEWKLKTEQLRILFPEIYLLDLPNL